MTNEKYRQAVFIVTYIKLKDKIEYLIMKRKLHWHGWEFPKGGIEKGEGLFQTVKREIYEETGEKGDKIKKFNIHGKYHYRRKYPDRPGYIGQTYVLFAVKIKNKKVKIGREHSDYLWLNFKDAEKRLTHKNQKDCLKIVNDWLENEKNNV